MKKLTYLLFLAIGVTACSVESMDSTENLTVADAKHNLKAQEAQNPMGFYAGPNLKATLSVWNDCDNLYVEIVPTGEDPTDASLGVFMDGALPGTNGGSGNITTDGFLGLDSATDLVWTIPLNEATSFNIFIKSWSNWAGASSSEGINQNYTSYTVDYSGCDDCEESFSYTDNEDGTYTFTYKVGEDMDAAEVVFTFAQGSYVSGLSDDFSQNGKGQTYEATMDLKKCDVLEYTVSLTANCNGGSSSSNVWTDFKVNDVSKKADKEDKFVATCN